jgi:hypothetical protein
MTVISAANFPIDGYALHVDVALGPDGPVNDAVIVVKQRIIQGLCDAQTFAKQTNTVKPIRLPGTAIMPGILDVHHHIIEPFVKALTGGEPNGQSLRRYAAVSPLSSIMAFARGRLQTPSIAPPPIPVLDWCRRPASMI